MVFVWGEGGQAAFEEALKQEPPLCTLTQETEAQGELDLFRLRVWRPEAWARLFFICSSIYAGPAAGPAVDLQCVPAS